MHYRAMVAAADIARMAGVGRAAVSNWRRRFDDFPAPVAGTSSNPLFSLAEVEAWLRRQGKIAEIPLEERVWHRLRASAGDLRLADAVGRAGAYLAGGEAAGDIPEGLAELARTRGPAQSFEFLLERYLEAHSRRVAVTPGEVADLMVSLAGVTGGAVLDPACGLGTLLLASAAAGATKLYGQERDGSSAAIARSRLTLHGHEATVRTGDSLRDDAFGSLEVDAVLCVPPFGERGWGYEELSGDIRWRYGLPPRGEPELPWVQHGLHHVRPGGHVVILMPPAAANRRSGRRIRAQLLRSGALRAVVALPAGSAPGALGSPHLWVLRKPTGTDHLPTHVLMVNAADLSWPAAHEHVVGRWRNFVSNTSADGAVPIIDVLDEVVDLTPGRHVTARAPEERHGYATTVQTLSTSIEDLARALDDLRTLQVKGEELPKTTVAEQIRTGALAILTPSRLEIGAGKIPVLTLDDVLARRGPTGRTTPAVNMLTVKAGDIVVPAGGRFFAVLVVDEDRGVLGPGLQILRADPERIDPACLAGFLRIAALRSPTRGQSVTSQTDIKRIEIPRIPLHRQRALGAVFSCLDRFEALLGRVASDGTALVGMALQGLGDGLLHPDRTP